MVALRKKENGWKNMNNFVVATPRSVVVFHFARPHTKWPRNNEIKNSGMNFKLSYLSRTQNKIIIIIWSRLVVSNRIINHAIIIVVDATKLYTEVPHVGSSSSFLPSIAIFFVVDIFELSRTNQEKWNNHPVRIQSSGALFYRRIWSSSSSSSRRRCDREH